MLQLLAADGLICTPLLSMWLLVSACGYCARQIDVLYALNIFILLQFIFLYVNCICAIFIQIITQLRQFLRIIRVQ